MNREIKFRAWDNNNKLMIRFDEYWVCCEYRSICWGANEADLTERGKDLEGCYNEKVNPENDGAYTLMQYTGLKDENGNEVYEGDFVEMELSTTTIRGVVVYDMPVGFFISTGSDLWDIDEYLDLQVIGNIYENHELLKQEL